MMKDGRLVRTGRPVTFTVYKAAAASHPANKKEQRIVDRQQLMDRVRDAGISKPSQGKVGKKRRRPGKKLVAAEDMGGMRDALPDLPDAGEDDEWEGLSDADTSTQAGGRKRRKRTKGAEDKIHMRSLQHRPGAMKRKRRMEGVEMERFGRNLAQLSANTKSAQGQAGDESEGVHSGAAGGGGGATSKEKWAALRAFIGSTMERKHGFEKL
jgi:hypothetical protein